MVTTTSTARPRLGVAFPPGVPTEQLRDVVAAALDGGFDDLWLSEDCFKQGGTAALASALAWSEGSPLRVGAGLLPVPLHHVVAVAMDLATLERLHPGRVAACLGHGIQPWMAQAGARVASPLTLLAEHLDAVRALLRGGPVTTSGRYVSLDDVRLDHPPVAPPPVYVGGAGPRTLALAAEHADGTLLALGAGPDEVRAQVEAGGSPVGVPLLAATGGHARALLEAERAHYGMPPDAPVGMAGSPHEVAEAVDELARAGAALVSLQVPSGVVEHAGLATHVAELGRTLRGVLGERAVTP